MVTQLTTLLEAAKEKAKNIFESYKNPEELFQKLGIEFTKANYSFFQKENENQKIPRKGGVHYGHDDKIE